MAKKGSKREPGSFLDRFLQEMANCREEGEFSRPELFRFLEQMNEQLAYWISGTKYDPRKGAAIEDFYLAIEVLDACCL